MSIRKSSHQMICVRIKIYYRGYRSNLLRLGMTRSTVRYPFSNDFGRTLWIERPWIGILGPGHCMDNFLQSYVVKLNWCLKSLKTNEKDVRDGQEQRISESIYCLDPLSFRESNLFLLYHHYNPITKRSCKLFVDEFMESLASGF